MTIGPDSNISYSDPGTLSVGRNRTLNIDASSYAADGSYDISCGDATGVDASKIASVSHTGSSCAFTLTPNAAATSGDTTFSIPITSAGGSAVTGTITVSVGPDSDIVFAAPSGLSVGRNRTLNIHALDHLSENAAFTVTCADATSVIARS